MKGFISFDDIWFASEEARSNYENQFLENEKEFIKLARAKCKRENLEDGAIVTQKRFDKIWKGKDKKYSSYDGVNFVRVYPKNDDEMNSFCPDYQMMYSDHQSDNIEGYGEWYRDTFVAYKNGNEIRMFTF